MPIKEMDTSPSSSMKSSVDADFFDFFGAIGCTKVEDICDVLSENMKSSG